MHLDNNSYSNHYEIKHTFFFPAGSVILILEDMDTCGRDYTPAQPFPNS